MQDAEFKAILEDLTPRQRKVLHAFLAGETDEAIAATLSLEASTVRRHLANVCKAFGLRNEDGQHYSYREDLLDLFGRHAPELVSREVGKLARAANPEFPGSPLALDSPFYIEPGVTLQQCLQEIRKPGALVRIRAAHRMGKTSLLQRLLHQAQASGLKAVRLNLRQAEDPVLQDLDTFLQWFSVNLGRRLGLPVLLDDYWDKDRFGSLVSCTTYVQFAILEALEQGLLLGLDEVDWLFEFPSTAQGFFALLRSWHEEANSLEVWQRLRLVVAHATEVYIPLKLHQSPFNVGLPVRLTELTPLQVQTLAQRYGLHWSMATVQTLTQMVGGHPYLIQLALYHLQQNSLTLDALLQLAPTQAGIYAHHLRRLWQLLQTDPALKCSLEQVIATPTGVQLEPVLAYKLDSMGLVHLQGNIASISCELYRRYFQS